MVLGFQPGENILFEDDANMKDWIVGRSFMTKLLGPMRMTVGRVGCKPT